MPDDDHIPHSFEDAIRSIAQEVGRSFERMVGEVDLDGWAHAVGVDPTRAREWADIAGEWFRSQVENFGEDVAAQTSRPHHAEHTEPASEPSRHEDPLRGAQPHPLDLPTEEQGLALAALESGRWTFEPSTNRLEAHGSGPGPNDALGLVRELRARDWIAADGKVTLVGRDALKRWLEARSPA
jgi:hypothetical protein